MTFAKIKYMTTKLLLSLLSLYSRVAQERSVLGAFWLIQEMYVHRYFQTF